LVLSFGNVRYSRVLAVALAATGVVAACSTSDDDPPPPITTPQSSSAPASLRRLLARQYKSSIEYVLGKAAAAAASPPSDTQINGFANIAASQLSVNDPIVAVYEASARAVAKAAMTDMAAGGGNARIQELVGCKPNGVDDKACFQSFVTRFGRIAWRRPLVTEEVDDYVALASKGALHGKDFNAGIQQAISAMLQSPHFLYQVEIGVAQPGSYDPQRATRKLTGYEVAARMSFLLLDRTPDAELIDAAGKGELDSAQGVRGWATKLLAKPEAKTAVRDYFAELFVLDDLATLAKDPATYPDFSPALAASMREEALRMIEAVVEGEQPLTDVLTTQKTFVDDKMAAFYGLSAPTQPWQSATLPAGQGRSGILTAAGVMARQAHATSTSATYRGLFVMERFLCTTMPPPPPDVVTTLPPSSKAPTLRDRLQVHQTNEVCKACHYMSDTIGLSFEQFDGIGKWRDKENGVTIDPSGKVNSLGTWKGPPELGAILASSDTVKNCMVRQLYRYATGHIELDGEWPSLVQLIAQWKGNNLRFRSLLVDLVASDLFRHVGAQQ
jgi:hypothetical protein